jgi:hypothetical protein
MKKLVELKKELLLEINGGSEQTYNTGYKVGEFFGKIGAMLDRFVEIFK